MNKVVNDILNSMDIGVIILNEQLEILLWNSFIECITGINNKTTIGENIFKILPNLNKNYFKKSLDIVLNSGYKMFFSAAMHRKLINDNNQLNIKISRIENHNEKFIILEFIDVTNQFTRIRQLKGYIKELYLLNKNLKEKEKIIQKLAYYDNLTGVANRTLFYELAEKLLSNAKRNNGILGLLLIDIDNFKNINDTYGHKTGDDVLVEVANILTKCTRKSDVVSRFGGDEFLVLLSDIKDFNDCKVIISRILNETHTIISAGEEINVSLSIGASLYPYDGDTIRDLMIKADEAMYKAKSAKHSENDE